MRKNSRNIQNQPARSGRSSGQAMGRLGALLTLSTLVLCLAGTSLAQSTNSADIRGTVTDGTGAIIPGAKVTILNVDTGVTKELVTNEAGIYDAVSVLPGRYKLTFEKEGFGSLVRNGINLSVGVMSLDAQLAVGTAQQQILITAEAPLLKTETGEQSATLRNETMTQLPNVNPDWQNFVRLLPGVANASNASGGLAINGNLPFFANYLADGGSSVLGHSANFNASIFESVAEVQVQTSSFSAQYGIGGAVFNQISKGGTNQFHGSAYEYLQNNFLNARNFFSPSVGYRRYHNFGGSIGGPIKQNKTFAYFNYDQIVSKSQNYPINTYPTLAARAGDFSDPAYRNVIYDPDTLVNGQRTPFANNKIPANRIDPVAAKMQPFFPLPTRSGVVNNWQGTVPGSSPFKKYFGRLDHNISSANRLTFSITQRDNPAETNNPTCPVNCYIGDVESWNTQISDVWTISPTVVNEFRFAFTREGAYFAPNTLNGGFPAKLGLQYAKADIFPDVNISGPVGGGGGGGAGGDAFTAGPNAIYVQNIFQPSDIVTMIHGKHILHFGGELLAIQDNSTPWGNVQSARFTFTGNFTKRAPFDGPSGLGYADFLLGQVSNWSANNTPIVGNRQKSPQFFVQDDFKILPNLTINLGLRYQMQRGWTEVKNRLGVFDPTITNPVTNTLGAMWFGGDNGRTALEDTVHLWLPRVGFAWAPRPKWSVRGGFGIYSYPWSIDTYSGGAFGFGANSVGTLANSDQVRPLFLLSDANPPLNYVSAPKGPGALNGRNVNFVPQKTPVAKNHQWSFSIQRELGSMVVEAAYVGSHGSDLPFPVDINQVPEDKLGPGDAQSRRPYPQFLGISGNRFNAISNYNAMQLSVKKRFAQGLTFDVNYTWSKMMSSMDSAGWGSRGGSQVYQRAHSPDSHYSLSNFDVPHNFKGSVVYTLPFGKGQKFADRGGVVDAIIGGWRLSSLFVTQSGNVFTPTVSGANNSGSQAGTWFPNVVGDSSLDNPTISRWFNPAAFAQPAPFTFGNAGRNILRGPGLSQIDFSMGKSFRLPKLESGSLQIRFDATNAINHASFNPPNAAIGGASAGQITSTSVNPRVVQLGARLSF